jgi:FKBP-type peptidyl-prolyl cis-trans isomerase FklB
MKKTILLALVILAGAFTATAGGGGKKDKKQKTDNKPVVLVTPSDSVSYAAGYAVTEGLDRYLAQQYQLDQPDEMAQFVNYFKDFLGRRKSYDYHALKAAVNVLDMLESRMLPGVTNDFAHTSDSIQQELFFRGFIDALSKDNTLFNDSTARKLFTERTEARKAEKEAAKKAEEEAYRIQNEEWLKENAKKEGVVTLPSGLQYKVLVQGNGKVAGPDDNVKVKYEGKMIDGTVFDSSYNRTPDTNEFKPTQVIKGWTEALTMMPAGSTWELYIPQDLAYGSRPAGSIKPYSTLIFKVEVVK